MIKSYIVSQSGGRYFGKNFRSSSQVGINTTLCHLQAIVLYHDKRAIVVVVVVCYRLNVVNEFYLSKKAQHTLHITES